MNDGQRSAGLAVTVFLVAALSPACSSSKPAAAQAQPAAAQPAPALWGDMKPVVSVKELMHDMIDPASDYIFDAVGTFVTKKGVVERAPKTDEDWEKVRIGAVTIAEGVYLLKVPRPFTPPGDDNNSSEPGNTESSPADILAKVQRDPVEWNARIEALRNVGLETLDIVKRKATNELWDAGDNLDQACEACHKSFWYPRENDEFYGTINNRLKELKQRSESHPSRVPPPEPVSP